MSNSYDFGVSVQNKGSNPTDFGVSYSVAKKGHDEKGKADAPLTKFSYTGNVPKKIYGGSNYLNATVVTNDYSQHGGGMEIADYRVEYPEV